MLAGDLLGVAHPSRDHGHALNNLPILFCGPQDAKILLDNLEVRE